ncbi:MAG: ABC transporter ATP-binding protein [Thermoplasmatales archaeon]|jgi:zinc transport system ATP-binding protein|nr:ABC transporter ATP-binding protein [Thermoplasmatales archaeon]
MSVKPIEIKNLTSGYDGVPAIENVNLELRDSDFLAVIGPNGGGKTTLFKTILGLIEPMSGEVSINGLDPSKGSRQIGYVPQKERTDPAYPIRVEDVVLMGLRARKGLRPTYSNEDREAAVMAMEYADISDLGRRRISDLSGGQLQRVFLARALAPEPPILLLDEPTASLDPNMKDCTYDILRKVNRERGTAIMIITHDMSIISHDVKRVACMNRRMIVNDAPEITKEMLELSLHCVPELVHIGPCTCGGDGND